MTKPADDEKDLASIVFTLVFMALVAIAAWRLLSHLPKLQPAIAPSFSASQPSETPTPVKPQPTPQPKNLPISSSLFAKLLQEQPDQNQSNLSVLLMSLSDEAVRGMGTYRRVNYEAWLLKARQSGVSVRAIEMLADARFVSWFPSQKGKRLNPRTLGQVWYAIARDQMNPVNPKRTVFNKIYEGILKQGQGKIYQAKLQQDQVINLDLETEKLAVKLQLISVEDNTNVTLKKTPEATWMGKISKSGIYEIVIAPNTVDQIEYKLSYTTEKR